MTIRSDNAVTVYNLRRQGACVALLYPTRAIFSLLERLDLRVHACHIPGVENVLTDALSRLERTGDYELRMDVYKHATAVLQVCPTVDLFAAAYNAKCRAYVIRPQTRQEQALAVTRTVDEASPTEKKLPLGLFLMALFCPKDSRNMQQP
jgi:hypothetical protein